MVRDMSGKRSRCGAMRIDYVHAWADRASVSGTKAVIMGSSAYGRLLQFLPRSSCSRTFARPAVCWPVSRAVVRKDP